MTPFEAKKLLNDRVALCGNASVDPPSPIDLFESFLIQYGLPKDLLPLLDTLTAYQSIALELRLGLRGYQPHSLYKMSVALNISVERARQLKHAALYKLLRAIDMEQLRHHLR